MAQVENSQLQRLLSELNARHMITQVALQDEAKATVAIVEYGQQLEKQLAEKTTGVKKTEK